MSELKFKPHSRVLLFAPHPDDESIAAGVFLQKAIAHGAAVRVIYATDGDDNPWPQRAVERKWRLGPRDRQRWGHRRRREAIAALEVLGLGASDARFLGLPDQGLTDLLLHDGQKIARRLGHLLRAWSPTHLLMPSLSDTHSDHSALAVLLRFVLNDYMPSGVRLTELSYLVHGRRGAFAKTAQELPQSESAGQIKRRAISCHHSQIKLSRKRFLAYAKRPELFDLGARRATRPVTETIRSVARSDDRLRLTLKLNLRPFHLAESQIYLVGHTPSSAIMSACLRLPSRDARVQLTNCATGRRVGIGIYRGNPLRGEIVLPVGHFAPDRPIFVKLNRRSWFFDEAGWVEIAPRAGAPRYAIAHGRETSPAHAFAGD